MTYIDFYPPRGSRFNGRAFVTGEAAGSMLGQQMIAEAKESMVLDALRALLRSGVHDRPGL